MTKSVNRNVFLCLYSLINTKLLCQYYNTELKKPGQFLYLNSIYKKIYFFLRMWIYRKFSRQNHLEFKRSSTVQYMTPFSTKKVNASTKIQFGSCTPIELLKATFHYGFRLIYQLSNCCPGSPTFCISAENHCLKPTKCSWTYCIC